MRNYSSILLILISVSVGFSSPHLHTLDNGLQVYLKEDHARPLISLFSIVDGGSRTETPDIAGLSHFYEHLIARGGSKRQAETEYRRKMMLLGESHIYTYDDGTAYGFTVPKENFDEALWRLADFMMDLIPDTAGIRKERTIVSEELYMSCTDSPWGSCYEQLMKTAFTEHPYYPTTIGLEEVVRSTTLEKLKTFYEERYVPNQIVMAVVGDFETEEMIAKIEEQYGHYPSGRISFELGRIEPPQTGFRQAVKEMDVSAAYVMLGYKIPPTAHPDMVTIKTIAQILGGGPSSRLYKALKIEDDLVYSVSAYPDFLRDESLLYISMNCDPNKKEAVIEKTFAEIKRLVDEPLSLGYTTTPKMILIDDDIAANETYRGQAENICKYAICRAPTMASYYRTLLLHTSIGEVKKVAGKYLDPSQATLSLIVPAGSPVVDYSSMAGKYSLHLDDEGESMASESTPKRWTLPNGLTLVGMRSTASPTVCVSAYVKGGQWLEEEGKAGVAYLTAKMLDKGTQQYSRIELAKEIEHFHIDYWNKPSEDFIQVGLKARSRGAESALHVLHQLLFHPTFPADEFQKAKADHLQAVRAVEDQPWEFTHREALRDLYQVGPYRNLVLGSEETVAQITLEDVIAYYKDVFVPSNIIIVIVGDDSPFGSLIHINDRWKDLPVEKAKKVALIADKPPKSVKHRLVYKQKDQNTFNISFLSVGVDHPDFLPMVLAKRILNTRLFFKYIYDKGMAYRMWTRMHPRMGQARFYFEMGVSDENFPIATQGILADLDAFLKNPISEEDLETAKKDEITCNKMTYQTNEGVAEGLGYWEAVGLGYEFFEEFPERIGKISAEQVEKAAKKYLGVDRYQLVNIGTAKVE